MSGAVILSGCQGGRLEDALQRLERPCPGITLVAYESLQDREHATVFRTIDVLDSAKQGRRIAEMRHISQKAQNLDLWIFSGLEPVMDFQHHLVAEDERGAALSGANTMDIGRRVHALRAETRRRREGD